MRKSFRQLYVSRQHAALPAVGTGVERLADEIECFANWQRVFVFIKLLSDKSVGNWWGSWWRHVLCPWADAVTTNGCWWWCHRSGSSRARCCRCVCRGLSTLWRRLLLLLLWLLVVAGIQWTFKQMIARHLHRNWLHTCKQNVLRGTHTSLSYFGCLAELLHFPQCKHG